MARALLFLVMIGLAVYAVADIATSEEDERLGLPKLPWMLLAVVVPLLGPAVWILVSRSRRAERGPGGGAGPSRGGPAPGGPAPRRRGPVAPDDDPEFLWRLEQDRIRRERETRGDAEGTNGDVPDGGARG
ncbi:PLD nuclease N-terminal domain-containing protein [Cellulomonas endometrii]|uniref:PLD nuclease N-terminal domain-containing protein n=1 Tax=Cellulomonas endometrii TaxID=3036301 RepID=UPI0024AD2B97|nr:PLD nuclease N-terminal domain-containing protein [Cellulomonas endometrii]